MLGNGTGMNGPEIKAAVTRRADSMMGNEGVGLRLELRLGNEGIVGNKKKNRVHKTG